MSLVIYCFNLVSFCSSSVIIIVHHFTSNDIGYIISFVPCPVIAITQQIRVWLINKLVFRTHTNKHIALNFKHRDIENSFIYHLYHLLSGIFLFCSSPLLSRSSFTWPKSPFLVPRLPHLFCRKVPYTRNC